LKNYTKKSKSGNPPKYNLTGASELHKNSFSIISDNWNLVNPVVQDYISSIVSEFENIKLRKIILTNKITENMKILDKYKKSIKEKFDEFKVQLEHKEKLIQEFIEKDKDGKFGFQSMNDDLERKIQDLKKTHHTVGESFQLQIMEMDAKLDAKDEEIERLTTLLEEKENELTTLKSA